jgi:hypothetical protein
MMSKAAFSIPSQLCRALSSPYLGLKIKDIVSTTDGLSTLKEQARGVSDLPKPIRRSLEIGAATPTGQRRGRIQRTQHLRFLLSRIPFWCFAEYEIRRPYQ